MKTKYIRLMATTVSVGLALQTWLCQLDPTTQINTEKLAVGSHICNLCVGKVSDKRMLRAQGSPSIQHNIFGEFQASARPVSNTKLIYTVI